MQSMKLEDFSDELAEPTRLQSHTLLCHYLQELWLAQRHGRGCLPWYLGMRPLEFVWCRQQYAAPAGDDVLVNSEDIDPQSSAWQKGKIRQDLLEMRRDEWQALRDLLRQYRAGTHPLETVFSDMLAAGCLGGDHLWRDVGFSHRQQLSELIQLCFPRLAEKNFQDMKWKKFFYKQLCEQEGSYVCRSPSCESCAAYADCFGPEE